MQNNSLICLHWIPRHLNLKADLLSRCYDSDDWSIADEIFDNLYARFGPFSIDRFATCYNTKCTRFNSKWFHTQAEVMNALLQNWDEEILLDCFQHENSICIWDNYFP